MRQKALKEEGKKSIAGVGDARLRYTHPFPANEPVTVRAVDPDGQTVKCEGQLRIELIGAKQPQPTEMGRNGKVERALLVLSRTANG